MQPWSHERCCMVERRNISAQDKILLKRLVSGEQESLNRVYTLSFSLGWHYYFLLVVVLVLLLLTIALVVPTTPCLVVSSSASSSSLRSSLAALPINTLNNTLKIITVQNKMRAYKPISSARMIYFAKYGNQLPAHGSSLKFTYRSGSTAVDQIIRPYR